MGEQQDAGRLGRKARSRRDLLKQVAGLAAASPLLVRPAHAAVPTRHPYLQHVLSNRATICWATREAGSGSVQISTDAAFTAPMTIAARSRRVDLAESRMESVFTQWEADATGLNPGTRYYYRVFLGSENLAPNESAADLSFRTAPASGGFRFLAFGDSGGNTPEQYTLRDLMLKEQAALVVHTGDVVYPFGSHQTYESYYLNVYRDLMKQIPFYPAVGNHDVELDDGAPYLAIHSFPTEGIPEPDRKRYYSVDWGDVHFVSLDSNLLPETARARRMLDWLNADLGATRKPWKIVSWHHTPHDAARGEEPEARLSREQIVPILERHGVQMVLCGHSHVYERTNPLLRGQGAAEGIVYVTTGGAGGGLHAVTPGSLNVVTESVEHYLRIDVEGTRLTVAAIGMAGREIDRFAIAPRPFLSRESTVNAASFLTPVAPGSLITIFGRHLAAANAAAPGLPLPSELLGVKLSLGGRELPLTFVSPGQITAQLPFRVEGSSALRVTTANGNTEIALGIQPVAPGIFVTSLGPAVVRLDGRLVTAASPARPGEFVSIYLTGLGDVRGDLRAGAAAPASPLLVVLAHVEVDIGGQRTEPSFAGLTPGQAGLYQINVRIPEGAAAGRRTLAVLANGVRSNEVLLEIA
jgi:acid phosphatase type 7